MDVVCDPCKEFKKNMELSTPLGKTKKGVSIGLESGDLLFLGLKGAVNHQQATSNLRSILYQSFKPVQNIVLMVILIVQFLFMSIGGMN